MSFYLQLHHATDIMRDESGFPFSWRGGKELKTFTDVAECRNYIEENAKDLMNVVGISGSASGTENANRFIASQLQHAGLLYER